MNIWFLVYVGLMILSLGINLAKHGQSREGEKYSFWSSLIGASIMITLAYMAIKTGF